MVPAVTGKEHVLSGSLRGLALTTAHHARGLLDALTAAEQGVADFNSGGWQGRFVAARPPADIVRRIQVESKKAFESAEMQARVEHFALADVSSNPEEFAVLYKAEVENYKPIVQEAKIGLQE